MQRFEKRLQKKWQQVPHNLTSLYKVQQNFIYLIPVQGSYGTGESFVAGSSGAGSGSAEVQANLTAINRGIASGVVGGGMPIGGLSALRNADYVDNIMDLGSMSDIGFQLAESYYSSTEILGMYGFMMNTVTGEFNPTKPILADSRNITGYRRAFWDMNLGGMGGDVSEIGRRFIPHDRPFDTYNPYENKMPGWVPGCFTAGNRVFTSNGYKNIEDMTVGDKVMTHNGRFMNVQWVNVRKYEGQFITLNIDGIPQPIKATEEHPFLVMRTEECDIIHGPCTPFINPYSECESCKNCKYSSLRWTPACDIQEGDFVVEAFPMQEYQIDEIPLPVAPGYEDLLRHSMPLNWTTGLVCGAYAAGCSIDTGLAVCYNYVDTIGDFCYHFNIQPTETKSNIQVNNPIINQWLKLHFGHNTLPSWIYNAPEEFKIGFVSAYIDNNSNGKTSRREITIPDPPHGMHQLFGTLEIYLDQYANKIYLASDEIYRLRMLSGAFGKLMRFLFERKSAKHTPSESTFILHRIKSVKTSMEEQLVYNLQVEGDHTYNVYGIAVHNSEYFVDFRHGDPFTKVKMGEARLPGAGYEALNKLHSDAVFGQYGAVERMKILGDIAPYSNQYRYYKKMVSMMNNAGMLSEEDMDEVEKIKERVRKVREPFELTPYKFKTADIKHETVTVDYVIDNNLFVTKEHPLTPIRLAGVIPTTEGDPTAEAAKEYLSKYIYSGAKLKIGVTEDPINRMNGDTYGSMKAVIYDGGGSPIQAKLARMKVEGGRNIMVKDGEMSPVDVAALYQPYEITVGKIWESIAHLDTPIHTKFMQVRSGLEMYERRDVYGKSYQSWSRPISDYLVPTFQAYSRHNPIIATALGAGLGALFGAKSAGRKIGAAIGGTVAGTMAVFRTADEAISGEAWIPGRRKKEREIEEYFDVIKYLKFKALYERTAELAAKREGVDIRQVFDEQTARGKMNTRKRRALEKKKQMLKLKLNDPMAYSDRVKAQIDAVNEQLAALEGGRAAVKLGKLSLQALRYKEEYESTLYGMDQIDYTKLYKALPKRERQYFQAFATASPEERQKILKLIPKNQRRLFQGIWGMDQDKKESLESYFKRHYLPDANWAGWNPDVSLDAVKIKVMKNEGVDIKEAGYWEEPPTVRYAPPIQNIHKISSFFNPESIKSVLRGAGLRDIELTYAIGPAEDANAIAINIDSHKNIMTDFVRYINDRGI
jgi:hypothetical protein